MPLIIYTITAGLFGWSIQKKRWGLSAFFAAMLVWLLLMQCIIAYSLHPVGF